jgi:hypothetical protein
MELGVPQLKTIIIRKYDMSIPSLIHHNLEQAQQPKQSLPAS